MDKMIEFPGYRKKINAKIEKAEKRELKRAERRKNALPPFLMVRSGVLDPALISALILIPLAEGVFAKYANQNIFAAFLCAICYGIPLILAVVHWYVLATDRDKIQKDLDKFIYNDGYLDVTRYESKRMAQIMTKYAAKHNPKFFDNLIKNPKSVLDEKTATAIIRGHIKSHPEDIQRVLATYKISTIPRRLYSKLIRTK